MKKLFITLAMLSMVFAGCQKNELTAPENSSNESGKEVFIASVEEFEAQTKTSMNADRQVVWSAGDRLAIFQGSSLADEYQLKEASAGLANGSFVCVADKSEVNGDFSAGTELPCNVAFYPYSDDLILVGKMVEDAGTTFQLLL